MVCGFYPHHLSGSVKTPGREWVKQMMVRPVLERKKTLGRVGKLKPCGLCYVVEIFGLMLLE